MTGPRPNPAGSNAPFGGSISPRTLILLLLVAVLVTTILAIRFTDFAGSSDNETTALYRQTGCLDITMRLTDHQPPVPLNQAEADTREQLGEVDSLAEVDPDTDEDFRLGDLVWAEYGELAPDDSDRAYSGDAWVLVFDDSRERSWWDRLIIRSEAHRFSAIYRAETGQVVTACTGRVSQGNHRPAGMMIGIRVL